MEETLMADNFDSGDHRQSYETFVKLTNLTVIALIMVVVGMTIGLIGGSLSLGVLVIVFGVLGTAAYGLLSE